MALISVSHLIILNRTMETTDVWSSVANKTHRIGHVVYEVEHLRIFKPVGATLSTRIFTSPDGNTCGTCWFTSWTGIFVGRREF
ncbi:hypothetical protein M3Y97_01005700 [Aphelenchoides bicaudatus]|nr:hypothetical protein M3Y97_01005700 [Aphelenchoides bicaudatus]